MIVLVDLDGVVADWGWGYNEWLGHYELAEFGPYESRPTWNLTEGMDEIQKKRHANLMNQVGFYASLPVVEHAREGIAALREEGHTVYFVSTPYLSNPTCASEKLDWVRRHFGSTMQKNTILTTDKTLVMGEILIDDKPLITGRNLFPSWKHLCFGMYGYSGSTESHRVLNWTEALEVVTIESWERELTA